MVLQLTSASTDAAATSLSSTLSTAAAVSATPHTRTPRAPETPEPCTFNPAALTAPHAVALPTFNYYSELELPTTSGSFLDAAPYF